MARRLIDGKPIPRRRPVNWGLVRRILRYRQDEKAFMAEGFTPVRGFTNHLWDSPNTGYRLVAARINRDGSMLYAKVEHESTGVRVVKLPEEETCNESR